MIARVKGIVLHHFNYGDSSVIAHIYSDRYGRLSVMINNIRGHRSKFSMNMIQSLSTVEMELYYKENREIQRIKEMSTYLQYQNIPYLIRKSTQAMFIAEVLYKSLREEEANMPLFEFLVSALQVLDLQERNTGIFHLVFLMQLSKYLGFFPRNNFGPVDRLFDLRNGQFAGRPPGHPDFLDERLSVLMHDLLKIGLRDLDDTDAARYQRTGILEGVLDYYQLHVSGFGKLRSLPVLKEILS